MGFLSECVNKCVFASSAFSWPLSLGFFFFFQLWCFSFCFILSYVLLCYIYCKCPTEAGLLLNDRQMARCYDKRGNGGDLGGIE